MSREKELERELRAANIRIESLTRRLTKMQKAMIKYKLENNTLRSRLDMRLRKPLYTE